MYEELIKRLRDAAKMSDALSVLLPHSEGNATAKLYNGAAEGGMNMGVYIKDMEMPTRCGRCDMCIKEADGDIDYHYECCITAARIGNLGEKMEDCPLVPVPAHGRLIDADALMKEFEKAQRTMEQHGREYSCSFMSSSQEISTEWYCVEDMVENAPTVIPAEEGET